MDKALTFLKEYSEARWLIPAFIGRSSVSVMVIQKKIKVLVADNNILYKEVIKKE